MQVWEVNDILHRKCHDGRDLVLARVDGKLRKVKDMEYVGDFVVLEIGEEIEPHDMWWGVRRRH